MRGARRRARAVHVVIRLRGEGALSRPVDLSPPRPAAALTTPQARAFVLVAEAAGTFKPPPGDAGRAMGTALYDLERLGLIMHAGRGWRLTPNGEARRPELVPWPGASR